MHHIDGTSHVAPLQPLQPYEFHRSIVEFINNGTAMEVNAMPVALDVDCYQAHAWVALTQGAADYSITNLVRTIGPTGIDLTTDVNVRVLHNMERSQFASDQ